MSASVVDIGIIGAGPYGLSLAAHLRGSQRSVRVFGLPMRFWSHHMGRATSLKSEGFASSLYDRDDAFTLKHYCAEKNLPYADIGLPVSVENFVAYGLEFQRRFVPDLVQSQVVALRPHGDEYEITTEDGEKTVARQVVIASGIMNFAHLPPLLTKLPKGMATHSSNHSDFSEFKGKQVAVLGAGASALDVAALLQAAGADAQLFARRTKLNFHSPPKVSRSLWERLAAPRSGLGTGWRSLFCSDMPAMFHLMPEKLRFRAVERHLGPAPCWFVRDAVEGRLPINLGSTLAAASMQGERIRLEFAQADQSPNKLMEVDHVIAGTGYKVALSRLEFLDPAIYARIRTSVDTPVLDRNFQSSVPGLYFVGGAAANSFGPLLRFACGANFAAKRVAPRLIAASSSRRAAANSAATLAPGNAAACTETD